ncbi:MAG: hypothetical protein GTO45_30580 [Candidatus Aminicenantes bacterium]|nr:hypothetical protein [Candidatus Aminicenantes bacterium]NIM83139.1 hypothetical protein [Candidatus Aminicenantes bacterium]NIN22519.1 hypothetical protein [Candidatus Aminicenantes bacterium]NIN46287.1 hypothetical protein [Candidatus Aminicenantes bacterium]NIN89125.1 hypothetical protein [Candidatus Aminicenantes bacterium]
MSDSKVAIISDVHANYQALQAALSHADSQGAADIWFLGDAVGYGPDPHRCLELLQKQATNQAAWILGNHDEVMRYNPNNKPPIDEEENNNHHYLRIQADPITQHIGTGTDQLTAFRINYEILDAFTDSRDFLLSHPTTSKIDNRFFLVHGGVRSGTPTTTYTTDRIDIANEFLLPVYKITKPVLKKLESRGIQDETVKQLAALKNREIIGEQEFMDLLKKTIGDKQIEEHIKTIQDNAFFTTKKRFNEPNLNVFFFGHTHHPTCFKGVTRLDRMEFLTHDFEPGKEIPLDDDKVWFLNPGSVGQPRDRDCRASYLVLDRKEHTVQLHRVEYNIRGVQKQMERLAMPINLISRLSKGR